MADEGEGRASEGAASVGRGRAAWVGGVGEAESAGEWVEGGGERAVKHDVSRVTGQTRAGRWRAESGRDEAETGAEDEVALLRGEGQRGQGGLVEEGARQRRQRDRQRVLGAGV